MNNINKIIIVALIIGLTIGAGYTAYSQQIDHAAQGKYNITIQTGLGKNGEILNIIKAPIYGTQDFELYKAERIALLKTTASNNPERIGWATITFKDDISTSDLKNLKNKYSLKLVAISGAASETFQNETGKGPGGIGIDVEVMGSEKLEWFSKIHYIEARTSMADLDKLSVEPNVILVDLNIDGEIHGPPYIP